MMETKVRVGVRVRPLLPNERAVGSEMVVKYPGDKQIGMGERSFTYDHVFGPQVAQGKLYEMTARPMLKPFLEGYNVTIIAYGQTGSGKTYTMGSEATCDYGGADSGAGASTSASSPQGLIPRFVEDLFAHLQQQQQQQEGGAQQQQREANVTASFLEIYGEDVYDLLDDSADASGAAVGHRASLPIREDAAQGIVVSGLKQVPVASRAEALQVLRKGTTNRTTAATLMNVVSSRSHAVFTITLQQVINPTAAPAPGGQPAAAASAAAAAASGAAGAGEEDEGEGQVVVSRLTFVDLAGSERLKRTGAEGERRREGIQINVGLLALGSVINALADEERLAKGKRVHVPYRQSKLTRLLQDALGGNSQTLFLACVSPADINASETLSTLYYANRARNIRNKPVKNTDSVKEELRCLRQTAAFLKAEMVRLKFQGGGSSPDPTGQQHAELMERPEVKAFLEQVGARLDSHLRRVGIEGVDGPSLLLRPLAPATPGANRYSYGGFNAAWHQQQALGGGNNVSSINSSTAALLPAPTPASGAAAAEGGSPRLPITEGMGTRLDFEAAAPAGGPQAEAGTEEAAEAAEEMVVGDPEKELAILAKLRELQQHEAQAGEEAARDQEALANVEGEMEQKEGLLEQLRQTLEGYHGMRGRYERLLKEVDALEGEKEDLHSQLEQAILMEQEHHRQQQQQQQLLQQRKGAGGGGGGGGNPVAAAAASAVAASLREKLKGVESQLDRLKVQKKQQENLQRLAERQRQELKALEENMSKLKATKAQLMKRQREAAKRHEQVIQQKRREVEALRKADRTLQKKMGRLELESRSHKVLLDRKDHCIRTLKEKAAKAETHVMRLLQLQNRSRDAAGTALHKRTTSAASGGGANRATPHRRPPLGRAGRPGPADAAGAGPGSSASSASVNEEKVEAARFLLDKLVEERLAEVEARKQLEQKTRDYEALVTELRAQAAALERLRAEEGEEEEEGEQEEVEEAIREAEARLEGLDVEMELCATAIAELQIRLEAAEQAQQPRAGASSTSSGSASKKKGAAASAPGGGCVGGLSEEAALKAVAELGTGEARVLLAGLLEGVVDARARAWELETEAKRRASAEQGLRLDKRKLERRLSESARGFEQRLTDLRSQHQKDLITLVRGVGAGGEAAGAAGGGGKAQERAKGGEAQGAEQEGEEQEREEAANAADEVAKRQVEALAAQNEVLESRCQGLATELDAKAAEAARLQQAAEAAQREARELKAALEALKQAKGQEEEDAAAMEELLAAWGELGLSDEKRRGLLDRVTSAPRSACRRLLDEAHGQRDAARARVDALRRDVRVLAGALGLPTAAEGEGDEGDGAEADLLALQERLEERAAELHAWVETRMEAAQRLAGEAQRLQSSLGPELEEKGAGAAVGAGRGGKKGGAAALAELQRLYEGMGWGEEEKEEAGGAGPQEGEGGEEGKAAAATVAAAHKVVGQALPALSEAGLKRWEDAVKGLRMARADLVLQLQDMLERARGACALLALDADGLAATLRAALAREARCPSSSLSASASGLGSSPLKSPRGRRRSSISTLPPGLRMDDAALRRMVGALTGPGAVAGLWAEEVGGAGGGATLREALPQARFIVEVGVECWNRRRELAGLCRAAAAGLAEAVVAAAGEGGQGGAEEEDVKVLAAGVEAVRAALPEEEDGEQEQGQGSTDGVGSSGTGMTEAEALAFVGAVESLLASVEAQRAGAKAALEALWDYFKVPAEERNAGVLERQPSPPPAGEEKEKEKEGDETVEAGDALMRIKAAVERAQAPGKERGEIEAWLAAVLERLRQALQALQTGLETTAALRGRVGVLADKQRRQESILKLDRDIAALEAEFKAFEERAKKDKGRLTNRKATSVGLLKEEQFRKGSQARARSLLARLKQELTEWVAREGQPFEASLLGADLQQLFQVAQESGGDWERARTELMHLCTQAPSALGPAGPGKQKHRRRSSPTSQNQLSPEMPRVSPTPSVDGSSSGSGGGSSGGGEPAASSTTADEAPTTTTGASSGGSSKPRDPFARVLSPTDSLDQSASISPSASTSTSSSGGVAATPVVGPGAGAGMGGFPGLNRLANAGTLSDMLVRGHALPAAMAAAKDAAASKRDGGPTKENVAKNE